MKNCLTRDEFIRSLEVANEHLKSAEILLQAGQYRDSISRSYYAFFDVAAALLAIKGLIPKTHAGALQFLALHYIKPGILSPDIGKTMRRLLESRQTADYEWQKDFSQNEAQGAFDEAKNFLDLIGKMTDQFFAKK